MAGKAGDSPAGQGQARGGPGEAMIEQSEIPRSDPIALFSRWLDEAWKSEPNDANAMALATATRTGLPSVRMVLLKGHGDEGFTFFTNAESRKGGDLRENPHAALLFHWKSLRRQVRIEGRVQEVSAQEADDYFHSRPFVSQLGSAASMQSRPLPDRREYIERVRALEERYKPLGNVPRPPQWTGFRLVPERIEFWLDRPYRLHDRRLFERSGDGWRDCLLYP